MQRTSAWVCAAVVMAGLACAEAQGQARYTMVQIPVVVNIYDDTDPAYEVTKADVDAAIKETNKILRQTGMKLVVKKINTGADAKGDNGDGAFTLDERGALRTFGANELKDLVKKDGKAIGKGLKISFGKTPADGSTTPGVSVHRNPTVIVKKRASAAQTAQTIAHEIGHVMTLCGPYKVNDKNGDGDYDDPGERANGNGHLPNTPGTDGNQNLMAPSNWRAGTALTPEQIEEMRKRRYKHGYCSTQWEKAFPAAKDKEEFGMAADAEGDIEPGGVANLVDLNHGYLTSLHPDDPSGGLPVVQSEWQLAIGDELAPGDEVSTVYQLGFDVDGDVATGVQLGSTLGIDRVARVMVDGSLTPDGLACEGELFHTFVHPTEGETWEHMDELPVTYDLELSVGDLDEPNRLAGVTFFCDPYKSQLGILEDGFGPRWIPFTITSSGTDANVIDDQLVESFFDVFHWQSIPTLTPDLNGVPTPGMPYGFTVSGLRENSPFKLFLDDREVFSGILDENGHLHDSFVFPSDLSAETLYFLTAQDDTGEFAASMTCPVPEPASLAMLSVGGLIALLKKRKA